MWFRAFNEMIELLVATQFGAHLRESENQSLFKVEAFP
jgi:hypothetical protein